MSGSSQRLSVIARLREKLVFTITEKLRVGTRSIMPSRKNASFALIAVLIHLRVVNLCNADQTRWSEEHPAPLA